MTTKPRNRIIASVQIGNVRLAKLDAVGPPRDFVIQGAQATINIRHTTALPAVPDADGAFVVVAEFYIDIVPEKEKAACFSMTAHFELAYRLPQGFEHTEAEMKEFVATNAAFNAWPYFRELVQSMTSRMGVAPVTLPLFRHGQALSGRQSKDK